MFQVWCRCCRSLGLSRCVSDWGLGEHWVFRCWWCHRDVSWRSCSDFHRQLWLFALREHLQEGRQVFRVWCRCGRSLGLSRCVSDWGLGKHGVLGSRWCHREVSWCCSDFWKFWLFAHGNICRRADRCFGFGGCCRRLGLSRCISDWGLGEHGVLRSWWCHRDVSWRSCSDFRKLWLFTHGNICRRTDGCFGFYRVWPESRVEPVCQ